MEIPNLRQIADDHDAGKRIAEAVNLALVADYEAAIRSFLAISLADGSCDGTLYDTWDDCMSWCERQGNHIPLTVTPDGITPADARMWLNTVRKLRDLGQIIGRGEEVQSEIFLPGGQKRWN